HNTQNQEFEQSFAQGAKFVWGGCQYSKIPFYIKVLYQHKLVKQVKLFRGQRLPRSHKPQGERCLIERISAGALLLFAQLFVQLSITASSHHFAPPSTPGQSRLAWP